MFWIYHLMFRSISFEILYFSMDNMVKTPLHKNNSKTFSYFHWNIENDPL